MAQLFAVVDVETSGLKADEELLLEIAITLTDADLEPISTIDYVVHHDEVDVREAYDNAVKFVQDMHDANGLWEEATQKGMDSFDVDKVVSDWLTQHKGETNDIRWMGNSLRLDLNFIEAWLPLTYSVGGYRSIDMSAVEKFLAHFTGMPDYIKHPSTAHRAMADVEMCLAQARHAAAWLDKGIIGAE